MANHRDNPRSNKNERGGVRANPQAVRSRQHETGGHPAQPRESEVDWIKPGEPTERACMQIRQGKFGRYPVFGVKLAVEERGRDRKFPAVVFYGAKPDPEGLRLDGALDEGTWIRVSELDHTQGFINDAQATLALTLRAQPEMQLALSEYHRELTATREAEQRQQEEQQRRMAEKRQKLLADLRKPVGDVPTPVAETAPVQNPESSEADDQPKRTKAALPLLATFEEILTAAKGSFVEDGLEIYITRSPNDGYAVRLKTTPEGHELEEVAKKNLFVDQNSLMYSDDRQGLNPESYVGNDKLRYMFRMWLRKRLQLKGVTLHEPVEYAGTNGAGNNSSEESEGNALGAEVSSAG